MPDPSLDLQPPRDDSPGVATLRCPASGSKADESVPVDNEILLKPTQSQTINASSSVGCFAADSDDEHDDFLSQLRRMNSNAAFVDRMPFQVTMGVIIIFNAIIMGIETDYDLGSLGVVLGHFFTVTWIVEMLMKFMNLGVRGYFRDPWNCMDFCLVWLSVADTWIIGSFGSLGMLVNLRILRLLRLCRLAKLLRLFRELWLLVHGMLGAARVLMWVCTLLVLALYVGALVMTDQVGKDCDETYVDFTDCHAMFGTMFRSMCTLFQVITLESWSMAVARPVMEGKWYMIFFFAVFLYVTTFGLLNIVMGVIVEQTLAASQDNAKKEELQKRQNQKREISMLRKIFVSADEDHDGMISLQDFLRICENEHVQAAFELLDLPVSRPRLARRLYEVLDWEGNNLINVDMFLTSICSLKDEGHVLDRDKTLLLMEVRHLTWRLRGVESNFNGGLAAMEDRIMGRLGRLEQEVRGRLLTLEGATLQGKPLDFDCPGSSSLVSTTAHTL